MILQTYLARRYLRSFLVIGGAFLAILFLIDVIEQIRRFADKGVGLAGAAGLAALNITGSLYAILPLLALLAGIAMFLGLSRSSEMVAIRAAGRSGLRSLASPAIMALLLGVAAVAVLNPIVAATGKRYDAAVARVGSGGGQAVSLGKGAVWLRQGLPAAEGRAPGGQVVIRAPRASSDATTLYDPTFLLFEPGQGPTRRIEAQSARLENGEWLLTGVKMWPLDAPNPEAAAADSRAMRVPTDLTAARIRDGFGAPEAVPVWSLPAFIADLQRAGFSGVRHRVWLWMELARPALMAAMVMLAAAFTMRPMRGRRTGLLVLAAFASGLGLFFLRNLAQVMAEAGQVPAPLAAFAPPLIGAALALTLLLRLEDG